ncbi:MAG: hypothetical protein JW894_12330 [Bacteroidales bacterium]|nr:hypothetical protein [Bacteroidales bacterium]
MESSGTSSANNFNKTSQNRQVPMYLIAIVITLAVVAILLAAKLFINTRQRNEVREALTYVEDQKTKLEGELNTLIVDYDSLKTYNDSLASQLEAEQEKIRKLLRYQASNTQKIKMYQNELETLRKIMRSYIVQIDSLNTRNQELTAENIEVREKLSKKASEYDELSKKTEELSSTVKSAQRLTAKNILAEGLNENSKPKDKIKKVTKIRVCFTVRENAVAIPGSKMIYLRIIRPDEVVLSSPDAGIFLFEGESMVYSAKRELDYDNSDIDMCIFWDANEELIEGTYFVGIYSEGFEIGTTTFALK